MTNFQVIQVAEGLEEQLGQAMHVLRQVRKLLVAAPELNAANWTEEEAFALNDAVCQAVCLMDSVMPHNRKQKRHIDLDPTWLQEMVNDLREQGCDEMFIQACIDDLKDGAEVTVIFGDPEGDDECLGQ